MSSKGRMFGCRHRSALWALESILPFSCHACYTGSGLLQTDHVGSEAAKCGSMWQRELEWSMGGGQMDKSRMESSIITFLNTLIVSANRKKAEGQCPMSAKKRENENRTRDTEPHLCYSMCSSASSPHLFPLFLFLVSLLKTNKLPQIPTRHSSPDTAFTLMRLLRGRPETQLVFPAAKDLFELRQP